MRELLIVGVDPGTTTGYAVLDTTGKVLKMRSSKQLELNSVVEEVVQLGSVLAIGTDKQKCPQLIEKIAAKTGAKIMQPGYDLPVAEKDSMTRGFAGNQHEKDSLAAALYAYKELEPLLQKIEKVLQQEGKPEFFREVTNTVVMTGRNIRDALRMAQEEEKPAIEKVTAAAPAEEKSPAAQKTETIEAKQLKRVEKENEILRGYVSKLLGRIKNAEKERRMTFLAKRSIKKRESDAALQKKSDEKEKNRGELLIKLQRMLNEKDRHIAMLKAEMRQLERIAAARNIAVKKLNTLGFEELQQKNGVLDIGENDIVLVENPDSFSEKTLDYLSERNVTILTRKKISQAVARILRDAGLTAMTAEGIIAMEAENFAAADRERLAEARKKLGSRNIFGLIENYKEERRIQLQ